MIKKKADLERQVMGSFPRRFSLRRRVAAIISWRRFIRHSLGLKVPKGWGWIANPKRALYNRLYQRSTYKWSDVFNRPEAIPKKIAFGVSTKAVRKALGKKRIHRHGSKIKKLFK